MTMERLDPVELIPNPWNTNRLTPEAETKLEQSITRLGLFKPILVRQLADGSRQILGGQHRNDACKRLGMNLVDVWNVGEISDSQAKEIGIVDNGRYGQDDALALSKLLGELGTAEDLSLFLPFDVNALESLSGVTKIDLDTLDLEEEDAEPVLTPPRIPKEHMVMRFKVPIADQPTVQRTIEQIIKDHGLNDSDSLVNAGDALIWIIRQLSKQGDE